MLFIAISKWKPGERNELLRRRVENGIALPEGGKILSKWTDLYGGREIMVLESDEHQDLFADTVAWSDPTKVEAQPI